MPHKYPENDKCCLDCQYYRSDSPRQGLCLFHHKEVTPLDVCPLYTLLTEKDNALHHQKNEE